MFLSDFDHIYVLTYRIVFFMYDWMEKSLIYLTVLRTDTGGLAKCAKVSRETTFKELGQMTL